MCVWSWGGWWYRQNDTVTWGHRKVQGINRWYSYINGWYLSWHHQLLLRRLVLRWRRKAKSAFPKISPMCDSGFASVNQKVNAQFRRQWRDRGQVALEAVAGRCAGRHAVWSSSHVNSYDHLHRCFLTLISPPFSNYKSFWFPVFKSLILGIPREASDPRTKS